MKSKTCSTCRAEKCLEEFHRHQHKPAGRENICKECTSARRRRLSEANPGRYAAYEAKKDRARIALRDRSRYALRTGAIVREPCFICGEKAEIHHPCSSDPLLVTWLCRSHHRQLHAEQASWGIPTPSTASDEGSV